MSTPVMIIVGLAVAFFVWILIGLKKQNAVDQVTAADNAAAYTAQHAADLAAWANSKYNPASPTYDAAADAYAKGQWFGPKNPAFDPKNRDNVNFDPTL